MKNMISKEIEKIIKRVQSDADKNNQKELQKLKIEIKKEFGSQTGVLVEEFQHRVAAIGEQYGNIKKTLDSHTEQIANILVDAHSIKLDMNDVKYQMKLNLDRKVDKVNFVDIESRIRVLEKK
jgi:hypothetical protein